MMILDYMNQMIRIKKTLKVFCEILQETELSKIQEFPHQLMFFLFEIAVTLKVHH